MTRALIIGYGNPLRSDDGFGWHAAEKLSACLRGWGLEVLTLHQLTPELAETASRYPFVVFIDAAADLPPGELRSEHIARGGNREPSDASSFSHFLTPASLLALTAELYGKFPDAYYLSVGGESFADGESISPAVEAAFEPLLAKVQLLITQS